VPPRNVLRRPPHKDVQRDIPVAEHGASDIGVSVVESIVADSAPLTGNFDLQTTFMRQPAADQSNVYDIATSTAGITDRECGFN